MRKILRAVVILLLGALTVFVQLAVCACAFRVTANGEWEPVQLVAIAFDGLFILAALRFLRRRPPFPAAMLFMFTGNVGLFFLALLAREAPYRFPGWFTP